MNKQIRLWDTDPNQSDKDALLELGIHSRVPGVTYTRRVEKHYIEFDIEVADAEQDQAVDRLLVWMALSVGGVI